MCSLNDGIDDKDEVMEKVTPPNLGLGTACKKCGERTAELVLRVRHAYCRECFLLSSTHKFRALLGKSRMVKPKEHVLVGFSGSHSSVALLHLIHQGINESSHKRLLFRPSVLYIDEGAILGHSKDERQMICSSVAKLAMKYGFPAYVITLDQSLEDVADVGNFLSVLTPDSVGQIGIREENDVKLKLFIDSSGSLTSKEDLVRVLRKNLLLAVASVLTCSKIFVADVETDLAVALLSNISLGRGAQLPLDVGFCDSRDREIPILRPMRDFMKKEVIFFNFFLKLENIFIPSLGSKSGFHDSIQKLTEKFITDLESDFPGTVSTVFRTGEKLSMSNTSEVFEESCALCRAPLDVASLKSSALRATEFSHIVSTLGPAGFDSKCSDKPPEIDPKSEVPKHCVPDVGGCGCRASSESSCHNIEVTWAEAEQFLCYGCKRISREVDGHLSRLPNAVIERVKKQSNYKRMREEIKDFLL